MKSLRFRASFAFASSLAVLLATISPAQADELWTPPIPKPGSGAVNIFEGGTGIGVSIISANKESGANSGAFLCEVVGQGKCAPGSGYGVVGELLLPKCRADESNCIESVSVFAKGTKPVPATFVEQLPGPTTPAYPDALIPQGSTKSLWNAEGVNHTGGNSTYIAYARLAFRVSNGKAVFTSIGAGVSPVVNKRSPMFSDLEVVEKKFGSRNTVGVNGIAANCEYVYQGNCGRAHNFAADSRISIRIRVSNR
ncbi:hypothetical protein [Rhodoluna sp. KAS3]|uniref:hypothetical protein n=1 Tax=Rhodoluna sp. KAS3 TaxID=942880 RepID=UPI00222EEFE3|nr:hypothetical protein [Rhodoluna sp. KAS3]BDS48535.1 hypothetical protein RKAS3_01120 [Rhodoluna sp. KAS3]